MAIVAGTLTTYGTVGIREDLSNVIYDISPEDTPFMSNSGKDKASQSLFEWQTDSLAAADGANAVVEGDEATFSTPASTTRLGNYQQISRKTLILSGTDEVVNKAGRKSELAYQMAKRSAELKRDLESAFVGVNQGAVAGSTSVARRTASLSAFVKTNVDKEGTGVNPAYTSIPTVARTDGATRAFTETMLKNVIALVWAQGGSPDTLMVGSGNKAVASGFAGIASKTFNIAERSKAQATIIGAADVYVSDFGVLSIIPNRFQRNRDAWLLDFDHTKVSYLRPFKTENLAKTGDAEKKMIIVEYGLKVTNEKALGLVADLA